ncbi:MAG: protein phosphatase 2C domain-containing protein [Treponema sp.]|nr:protein phosphatase 2C domain-containing protein [Treponema sp.]
MNRAMFAYSFQGLSHIRKEDDPENGGLVFPCQDRSFSGDFEASEIPEKKDIQLFVKNQKSLSSYVSVSVELKPHKTPFSLVCVSDGHGSSPHFWSDKGAEFAIQAAVELLAASIDKVLDAMDASEYKKANKNLAKSYVKRWNRKCFEYLCSVEIDDLKVKSKELEERDPDIAKRYLDELHELKKLAKDYNEIVSKNPMLTEENQKEIGNLVTEFSKLSLKEIFGCTSVVYFQAKDSPKWYAFKIGDSDLFVDFGDGFSKPIKDDPKCFLNETTSLCNSKASDSFCFPEEQFLDKVPISIFASTDGVANSFSSEEYLSRFYGQIQFSFDEDGEFIGERDIKNYIPELSERGSGDDVSIAGIVTYDNSIEARTKKRENAKVLADTYFKNQEWDKINTVLKPFVDKGEPDFIFKKIVYDCNAAKFYLGQGLSIQSLNLWKQAFVEISGVITDSRFITYHETLNKFVEALHKLMNLQIEKTAKERIYSTGDDEICALFDSVISENDEVFIFYKVNYEYQLISYRYEAKWISGLEEKIRTAVDDLIQAYHLSESQKNLIMVKVKDELRVRVNRLLKIWASMWE